MLLRGLRWGLAGALVAWTVVRALGLERGWPLVPLLAFTPHVALLAVVGAAVAAWRRWWAGAAVGAVCAAVLATLLVPRAARAYDEAGIREHFPYTALRPLPGFTGTGLYARVPLERGAAPAGTLFG